MNYRFNTDVTMKAYNRDKYWIDRDIVPEIKLSADNLKDALKMYADDVNELACIEISKNALKTKSAMYRDSISGVPKQIGYVLTGKTLIENRSDDVSCYQYVDLWTEISIVQDTVYPEF